MNIGVDAKRIFFNSSGLGNYGRRFYRALAKHLPEDSFYLYSPRPVADDNPYLEEIRQQNSVIITPPGILSKSPGSSLWRSSLINKQLKEDRIDIYYGLSNEIPFGIKSKEMKKVVVIHDLIFLRYPELYPSVDAVFYRKKSRYACSRSDYIIAASQQTKLDIIEFYGIPENKIRIINPGSEPMFYTGTPADSSGFFKTAKKYIISIGAITPRKNLMKTVQTFNKVKDKYDLDLVVIGTAVGLGKPYLKKIEEYISFNGFTDRVHFLGNVPYRFIPDLCRKAEMMIYPSQFEGFGMPIVEGLFSRIPVITSKGGCFPEAGGDGAIYTDPEDTGEMASWIGKLMESADLRKELVEKGSIYATRFRQENIDKAILDFHHSATGQSFTKS